MFLSNHMLGQAENAYQSLCRTRRVSDRFKQTERTFQVLYPGVLLFYFCRDYRPILQFHSYPCPSSKRENYPGFACGSRKSVGGTVDARPLRKFYFRPFGRYSSRAGESSSTRVSLSRFSMRPSVVKGFEPAVATHCPFVSAADICQGHA